MSEINIARPYARAAFEHATAAGNLADWADSLDLLRRVVADERVAGALGSPRLSRERKGELVLAICGEHLGDNERNLVRLLADNGRLAVIDAIADHFEALRARAENRIDAEVRSARELNDSQREKLTKALARRLNREVRLHCTVDEELIGGVLIRAGDLVIDDSVKGRLQRLSGRLAH